MCIPVVWCVWLLALVTLYYTQCMLVVRCVWLLALVTLYYTQCMFVVRCVWLLALVTLLLYSVYVCSTVCVALSSCNTKCVYILRVSHHGGRPTTMQNWHLVTVCIYTAAYYICHCYAATFLSARSSDSILC